VPHDDDTVLVKRADLELLVTLARRGMTAMLDHTIIPELPADEATCRLTVVRCQMLLEAR
jgi:hypothetical protein